MLYPSISGSVEIREVSAPVVAGAAIDNNSDIIDMAGHEGALFILPIEDSVVNGVAKIQVEQNTLNQDAGMTALPTAVATKTAAGLDDLNGQVLIVDIHHPTKQFIQLVATSLVANIAFGTGIVILYGKRKHPVVQGATVAAIARVSSPDE